MHKLETPFGYLCLPDERMAENAKTIYHSMRETKDLHVITVKPALRKILCKKKSNQTLPVKRADREILLLIALFPEWERGMRASA